MGLIAMHQLPISYINQLSTASNHRRQRGTVETVTANPSHRGALGSGSGARRTSPRRPSRLAFVAISRDLRHPTPSCKLCVVYRKRCRGPHRGTGGGGGHTIQGRGPRGRSLLHACGPSADEGRPKLGGKDPAYVRSDADLAYTVAELVDGE